MTLPGVASAQLRIVAAEDTVMLEHEDRMARLRGAIGRLGISETPRFSVTTVPRSRMPDYFNTDAPVLRVAFSERAFFDTAKWTILPQGLQAVAAVAAATRGEAPDVALFVAGHTDNRGGDAYNQNLSVSRANSVSDALMRFGVGEVALWRVGFGESTPLYANDTDEHRGFNRRVEFLFGARVEPVVDVLSHQLDTVCVSASEAESHRCRQALPSRDSFEAIQVTARQIGVPLDATVAATAGPSPTRSAPHRPRPRTVATAPRSITIPLRPTMAIAAPVR